MKRAQVAPLSPPASNFQKKLLEDALRLLGLAILECPVQHDPKHALEDRPRRRLAAGTLRHGAKISRSWLGSEP